MKISTVFGCVLKIIIYEKMRKKPLEMFNLEYITISKIGLNLQDAPSEWYKAALKK